MHICTLTTSIEFLFAAVVVEFIAHESVELVGLTLYLVRLVALCFVAVLCPGLFVGRFVAVVIVEHRPLR